MIQQAEAFGLKINQHFFRVNLIDLLKLKIIYCPLPNSFCSLFNVYSEDCFFCCCFFLMTLLHFCSISYLRGLPEKT